EWEVVEDLVLGVAIKHRALGRVLEDVSVDGGETFLIGNPGHLDADAERALVAETAGLPEGPGRTALARRLAGVRALGAYERPRRDHTALELTALRRVSRRLFVQASYTWSAARGNYPGLFNADTGEILPNISTQYDLPE